MDFEQFKSLVIADLGRQWEDDMIHGFRDFDAEGKGGSGYQFSVPSLFSGYIYQHGEWQVCAGRGVFGKGKTLEEAHRHESELYDRSFDAIES